MKEIKDLFRIIKKERLNEENIGGVLQSLSHKMTSIYFPIIFCNDGFHFSMQASSTHYSEPRKNIVDFYDAVEIGFPSETEELLHGSLIQDNDIFYYIKIEIVYDIIKKHGGIDIEKTFKDYKSYIIENKLKDIMGKK